jgi:hypothetical protein
MYSVRKYSSGDPGMALHVSIPYMKEVLDIDSRRRDSQPALDAGCWMLDA